MLSSDGAALQCGLHTVPYKHEEQRGAVQLLHTLHCLLHHKYAMLRKNSIAILDWEIEFNKSYIECHFW